MPHTFLPLLLHFPGVQVAGRGLERHWTWSARAPLRKPLLEQPTGSQAGPSSRLSMQHSAACSFSVQRDRQRTAQVVQRHAERARATKGACRRIFRCQLQPPRLCAVCVSAGLVQLCQQQTVPSSEERPELASSDTGEAFQPEGRCPPSCQAEPTSTYACLLTALHTASGISMCADRVQ